MRCGSGRGLDPLPFHGRGTQLLQHGNKVPDFRCEFRSLRGGDPGGAQAPLVQAVEGEQLLQEANAFPGGVITVQVIAVPDVSAAHEQAVHPFLEGEQHVVHGDASAAHHPHNTDVGGILKPTDPGQVSSGVGSPGAEETKDLGLEIGLAHDKLPRLLYGTLDRVAPDPGSLRLYFFVGKRFQLAELLGNLPRGLPGTHSVNECRVRWVS
jgi:hypothetical protein